MGMVILLKSSNVVYGVLMIVPNIDQIQKHCGVLTIIIYTNERLRDSWTDRQANYNNH